MCRPKHLFSRHPSLVWRVAWRIPRAVAPRTQASFLVGQDAFMVSRQAAAGFSDSGNLKGDALAEASQYCAGRSQELFVTNTTEAQPTDIRLFSDGSQTSAALALWAC